MKKSIFLLLFFTAPAWADDMDILQLRLEINQLNQQLRQCNFERGKLQIEAGSLRQAASGIGYRELKDEETKLKIEIEQAEKK